MGQHSIIDFCSISADLFSSLVNICVEKGAELLTNYHLVICILRGLNHQSTRKRFETQRTYRIKWELLANKNIRHTFACKVAFLFTELSDYTEEMRLNGIYLNQQSLHLQLLVVIANIWEVK